MANLKGATDTRFADIAPSSYDAKGRTVECVISVGSPVQRFYGTEILRIHSDSIILDRMKSSGIPLLDSHQQVGLSNHLGRFTEAWVTRGSKPSLMGRIKFNDTPEGRKAEGMVARGEIMGISAGYRVDDWEVKDKDGRIIDMENSPVRWDDNLTFTATRWELFEGSLVSVPADPGANVRSFHTGLDRALPITEVDELRRGAISITKRMGEYSITYEYPPELNNNNGGASRVRMLARQRMVERMRK